MPDNSENWGKSLGHIKNAMNALVENFLRNADLLAVQGTLGLALFFLDTPNPQILSMLTAAAMHKEPGKYLAYALSFCSKAERVASQVVARAEQDCPGAPVGDLGSIEVSSNCKSFPDNSDCAMSTHLDTAILSLPNMDTTSANLSAYDYSISHSFDQIPNARMDLEFPFGPFWNFQDSPFGSSSRFDFGNREIS
ncbi:hypothetical protein ACMFMG_006318 [Clarireedia jacksonii]